MKKIKELNRKIFLRYIKENQISLKENHRIFKDIKTLDSIHCGNNVSTWLYFSFLELNEPLIRYDTKIREDAYYENLNYIDFIIKYLKINNILLPIEKIKEAIDYCIDIYSKKKLNSEKIVQRALEIKKTLL